MIKYFLACASVVLGTLAPSLTAQTISIAYQTPDNLVVCAADTLRITVQNNTTNPMAAALLDIELPPGLRYRPGSATSGASDADISNLGKPVLALPDLMPGIPVTVEVQLEATCGLVAAINSAQLFSALLRVRAGAVTEQTTTSKFQIQTSLLVITQVDNAVLAGEKGDLLTRTLHVRNTRLGPVRHLFLHDAHPNGISIHVNGAVTEQNDTTLYSAYFDGAFFSQFGNGDTLLDFGETALVKQEIEITDCGFPAFNCRSDISAGWSCTATDPICQADSTLADVNVAESSFQPLLTFETHYALPWDRCADLPHEMRLRIVNRGEAPATNLVLQINSEGPLGLGMDKHSFRLRQNGTVSSLTPNLTTDFPLVACAGKTASGFVTLFMPEIAGHDTVDISFDAFYCMSACLQVMPKLRLNYYYNKPCPPAGFVVADTVTFEPRASDYLTGVVKYSFQECLVDGKKYSFTYQLNSARFLNDTGFLFLKMDLPLGLEWSPDCPPLLGGQPPAKFTITPMVTTYQVNRVLLAFEFPLNDSIMQLDFCLKNTCRSDGSFVKVNLKSTSPGVDIFGYVPQPCLDCAYEPKMSAYFWPTLDLDVNCAWGACDSFQLQTECPCPVDTSDMMVDSCLINGVTSSGCGVLRSHHQGYRLNYDLPDNNNDRTADPGGVLDLGKVRRDRFLVGDTVRNLLSTKVLCGDTIQCLLYQVFTEIIGSDFGYAGVYDTFHIGPNQADAARFSFTDLEFLKVTEAEVTFWDSSANAVYTCPVTSFNPIGGLYGHIVIVNSKPPRVVDEFTTANFPYRLQMDELRANGCLPPDFVLSTGDSVQLRVDLKLGANFAPKTKPNSPPLVNFEMGYNLHKQYLPFNYRIYDTLMMQYSGYIDSFNAATFGIRPCEPSQQVTPFAYDIRIARENLFPFEVRPLSKITNYDLVMKPPGLVPQSATLLFLNRQKNTMLLQNLPLPFVLTPDSMVHVDFAPAYVEPIDEGYGLRTRLVFDPNCAFTKPDSSAAWVTATFPGCMSMPNPITRTFANKLGFFSNSPRDTITTTEPVLDFPTEAVSANFLLRNLAPVAAPNYWVQLVNPEGGLVDPTITILGPGTVVTPANGVFQLGTLPVFGLQNLRVSATNTTCDPQHLLVIYGWDCSPVTQPDADACGRDTLEILLRPQNPEIELELVNPPTDVPLCDTSDYFVLELSNADLGHAYKPYINIELPPGLLILPGSCEMAYPANSTYLSIPDPTDKGNGVLEWNLAVLQDSLEANGLLGVYAFASMKNALRIRFRVMAECGVVSNTQLLFGAHAEWYCGRPTNSLRKASDPIIVQGSTQPTYSVQIGINEPVGGPVPCNTERTLSVNLILSGPALPGDSVYVELPPSYAYVPGSYLPGQNALPGGPQTTGNLLRWALPIALPANSSVQFSFRVVSGNEPNCDGGLVRISTRQSTSAFCPTINDFCTIYTATGEKSLPLEPYTPDLTVTDASGSINATGSGTFSVDVANNGGLPALLSVLQIVRDVDGDGKLSAADTVFVSVFPEKTLAAGGALTVPIQSPNPLDLCNLLVVVPAAENCACDTVVFPLTIEAETYAPKVLCLGDSILLGLANGPMIGHIYTWTGSQAPPCTDCPQFKFLPPAPGPYTLTLTDSRANCTVRHAFLVQVYEPPTLISQNTGICQGQQAVLETSVAALWQWSGPGIANPGAAMQTVRPVQSATYYVTATSAEGCVLSDSVEVTVYLPDTTDRGVLRTCEGTPVDVFGTLTETSGAYRDTLTNANGCDSLVLLVLEVEPNTEAEILRCSPDTVVVFGKPVTVAGTYCDTIPSSLGCDSIHCITVRDYPIPDLPEVADTIYFLEGTSVLLPGPGGYAGYLWMPPEWLDCPTCPSPIATPPDTIRYTLVVRTGDDCPDTIVYFLIPFPPCDPARISMPNTFTPDGDGVNDTFTPVVHEGVEVVGRLTVYNRWGQKVYESGSPNAAWDGSTLGEPAPSDVYAWLLEVLCTDGERKLRWGDVTVLR
ncbi:MAG: gliding motility-associated C-terminal domain-containing protein [Saprospiraceae bacterium]